MEAAAERIYLTGPMASGKSTVGNIVANQLKWAFVDLDDSIEKKAGAEIPAIFENQGEAAFREQEREALMGTAEQEHVVVATGGGALVQSGAMDWARLNGLVVYLKVEVDELVRRVQQDDTKRPLLDQSEQDLRERTESILEVREPIYRDAHLTIEAGRKPEEIASQIVQAYEDVVSRKE